MKKSELIQIIKEEHKYIKNLLEQKGRIENLLKEKEEIEKQLNEIDAAENPEDGAADCDETTAIGLGKNIEHSAGHEGKTGTNLKKEEDIDEMSGLSHSASNAVGANTTNPIYKNRKKRGYVNEEEEKLRKLIKTQLYESYGLKKKVDEGHGFNKPNLGDYGGKNDAHIVTIKQDTTCKETGKELKRGERALFNPSDKNFYHLNSPQAQYYIQNKPKLVSENINLDSAPSPKQISEEEAEQVFNSGNYIYIKTDEGNLESTRNLFLLSNKMWDGSMNIYKANQTPEEYGFQNILNWIKERTQYALEFYTLYSKIPTMIGN